MPVADAQQQLPHARRVFRSTRARTHLVTPFDACLVNKSTHEELSTKTCRKRGGDSRLPTKVKVRSNVKFEGRKAKRIRPLN